MSPNDNVLRTVVISSGDGGWKRSVSTPCCAMCNTRRSAPATRTSLKLVNRRVYEKSGIVSLEYEAVRDTGSRSVGRVRARTVKQRKAKGR